MASSIESASVSRSSPFPCHTRLALKRRRRYAEVVYRNDVRASSRPFYARTWRHWQAFMVKPALDETVRKCASVQTAFCSVGQLRRPNCCGIIVKEFADGCKSVAAKT